MFSTFEINELRIAVRSYMSEYRYNHTLGVERAASALGSILLPESLSELQAAALLHDVTKELSIDEQLILLDSSGTILTDEDKATLPAIHSFSAVPFIRMNFPRFATENILSSVSHHTLGAEKLSLFDKIIFISDFIEDGRAYTGCIKTAELVRNSIKPENTPDENMFSLDQAIVMALDFTISSVISKNQRPHSASLAMRHSLCGEN